MRIELLHANEIAYRTGGTGNRRKNEMNNTLENLLAIDPSNRKAAYAEMRADLENDWIHVSPSALRNRFHSANKRLERGGRHEEMGNRDVELIESDVADYDRKRHIKHLLAVLCGNYDSVLVGANFEWTVRYSDKPEWNAEAKFIADARLSEISK